MSPIGIHTGLKHGAHGWWPPIPIGLGGLSVGVIANAVASDVVTVWLQSVDHWIAEGATWLLSAAWGVLSATTEPVLTGSGFQSELGVMVLLGVGIVLPLLFLSVIQAVAKQDAGGLVRTALIRLPLALIFTGAAVELVSLGLSFTDQASAALVSGAGAPVGKLFTGLELALTAFGTSGAGAFGGVLVLAVASVIAFLVWLELAVRSAGVAAATLFLPLALAGLVWPATSHWARRLGETLASLVLMKLVMAAVLALAAGALGSAHGISGIVEGLALLFITALSPFALMRLIPMVESGAATGLEGVSRRPLAPVRQAAWMVASHAFGAAVGGGGSAANAAGSSAAAGSLTSRAQQQGFPTLAEAKNGSTPPGGSPAGSPAGAPGGAPAGAPGGAPAGPPPRPGGSAGDGPAGG